MHNTVGAGHMSCMHFNRLHPWEASLALVVLVFWIRLGNQNTDMVARCLILRRLGWYFTRCGAVTSSHIFPRSDSLMPRPTASTRSPHQARQKTRMRPKSVALPQLLPADPPPATVHLTPHHALRCRPAVGTPASSPTASTHEPGRVAWSAQA